MGMTNPDELIESVAAALKAMPDLVNSSLLKNGASSISVYHLDYAEGSLNLEQAQVEQDQGSILVYWRGTRVGPFLRGVSVKHDIGLSIKPIGKSAEIFYLIRESECTITGQKFKLTQVHENVRPPEEMICTPRIIFVSERYGGTADFMDITFTLVERGIDN